MHVRRREKLLDNIKIWNISNGECIKTIECGDDDIDMVEIKDNFVFMKYKDIIKFWDITTGKLINDFSIVEIKCIRIYGNYILIGCSDGFIHIWNWQKDELVNTFRAHDSMIHEIQILKDKIISFSCRPNTIKIWSIDIIFNNSLQNIQELFSIYSDISKLIIDDGRLFTMTPNILSIWDLNCKNDDIMESERKININIHPANIKLCKY